MVLDCRLPSPWYAGSGTKPASGDEEVDGGDADVDDGDDEEVDGGDADVGDGDDEEVDGDDAVDSNHLAWPEQFHGTSNRGWVPPRILWLELCVVDEDCNCEADLSRC